MTNIIIFGLGMCIGGFLGILAMALAQISAMEKENS